MAEAALLLTAGGAWYGHQWWTVGRFIESTDDGSPTTTPGTGCSSSTCCPAPLSPS